MKKYKFPIIIIAIIILVSLGYVLSRIKPSIVVRPSSSFATLDPNGVNTNASYKTVENGDFVKYIASTYGISYQYPKSFTAKDPKYGTHIVSAKGNIDIVLCGDGGPNFESKEDYKPVKSLVTKYGTWNIDYLKQDLSYINGKPTQDDMDGRYIQATLRSSKKDSLTPMLITAYFKSEDDKYFTDTINQIIASFTVDGNLKNCSYPLSGN